MDGSSALLRAPHANKALMLSLVTVALAASDCGSAEKRVWCRKCEYGMAIYQADPNTGAAAQVAAGTTFVDADAGRMRQARAFNELTYYCLITTRAFKPAARLEELSPVSRLRTQELFQENLTMTCPQCH